MNEDINSIYFGGGTPSLMSEIDNEKIFNAINKKFQVSEKAEVTMECNPDDINILNIRGWKKNNVNRISLGVQSFFDSDLRLMNRSHDSITATNAIELIKEHFGNFSVDLIYGIPESSIYRWKKNIEIVLKYDVPHISTYVLTVEPKTALIKLIEKNKVKEVSDINQKQQFEYAYSQLLKLGYRNYEFSSFAKPGYECKNNVTYWERGNYLGFGPSAHSFDGFKRKWNISNNQKYIDKIKENSLAYESEILSETDILNELIMIGLRTSDGIDLGLIESKFINLDLQNLKKQIDLKITDGILVKNNNKLYPSRDYKFLTDGIASDLFIT